MIITILHHDASSRPIGLANRLATLRAHAGRNVLLMTSRLRDMENIWEAIDVKLGAIAWTVPEQHLGFTLSDAALHYHDIVIDAGTRDSLGSRSVLAATNTALIPIHSGRFNTKTQARFIKRIGVAHHVNSSLRVLAVIMDLPDILSIREMETTRAFVTAMRATTLIPPENAALSELYRSLFQSGDRCSSRQVAGNCTACRAY